MNELKRKKLNVMLENFILKQSSELLTRASMGWIYALSYDKEFLIQNFELKKTYKKDLKKKK